MSQKSPKNTPGGGKGAPKGKKGAAGGKKPEDEREETLQAVVWNLLLNDLPPWGDAKSAAGACGFVRDTIQSFYTGDTKSEFLVLDARTWQSVPYLKQCMANILIVSTPACQYPSHRIYPRIPGNVRRR
jgi:hypothetical protein